MAQRKRRGRSSIRTASKNREQQIIDSARHLRDHPQDILPETNDPYAQRQIGKLQKTIDKMLRYKDDETKLEKLSAKKGFDAALAGTLLIAKSEKAPYLAVIKTHKGDITYAQRGAAANKEMLIGLQHPDDITLKLLAMKDYARKKHLIIYSWPEGYICTGKNLEPPQGFIDYIIDELHLQKKDDGSYVCPHTSDESTYLDISWKSAGILLQTCQKCGNSHNTITTISDHLLAEDMKEDFTLLITTKIKTTTPNDDLLSLYLKGTLTDGQLIQKCCEQQHTTIKTAEGQTLIYNGKNHGDDLEGFINDLDPKPYERDALTYILQKTQDSLIENDSTPNNILERYWREHSKAYFSTILDDQDDIDYYASIKKPPTSVLKSIDDYKKRRERIKDYPHYATLPPLADYANIIARTYIIYGIDKTLNSIKERPDTSKGRSIAYAFLYTLGKGEDRKWKYTGEEVEYGKHLSSYAKSLLHSDPTQYHKALTELIMQSGSNEQVPIPE